MFDRGIMNDDVEEFLSTMDRDIIERTADARSNIVLIYDDEEPWRMSRLKKTINSIEYPTVTLISKLEDYKGILKVYWKAPFTNEDVDCVTDAWSNTGEHSIEHHFF